MNIVNFWKKDELQIAFFGVELQKNGVRKMIKKSLKKRIEKWVVFLLFFWFGALLADQLRLLTKQLNDSKSAKKGERQVLLKIGLLIAAVTLLPGCFLKHTSVDYLTARATLSGQPSVYVALPDDSQVVGYAAKNVGLKIQGAIVSSLGSYTRSVVPGSILERDDRMIQGSAAAAACAYVVVPKILHWEDQRTEWTAKPDIIKIRIDVLKTDDMSVIESAIVNGSSTWWTLGGDHPEHLLQEPMTVFVDNLMTK